MDRRLKVQIMGCAQVNGFTVLVGSRNLERGEVAARTIDGDAAHFSST